MPQFIEQIIDEEILKAAYVRDVAMFRQGD